MATKKEWIKVLNAILISAGCRDLCKKCIRDCCSDCRYHTDKGCRSASRSLVCTLYTCTTLDNRLKEFHLAQYFYSLRNQIYYPTLYCSIYDMRNPHLISDNQIINFRKE